MIEQILQADRFLKVDQVESAEAIYGRVAEADPGNAIAVVGLARCALFDGDDQAAYDLASRALEIDPENDMARRMEARLSEILATRGEPVQRPQAAATPGGEEMRPVITEEPRADQAGAGPATVASTAEPARTVAEPTATVDRSSTPPAPAAPDSTKPTPPNPQIPPPAKAKEPAVRKSLFDRLLGR